MQSVAVELTARCNQRCTYCYNAWRDDGGAEMGELDTATLLQTLGRVIDTGAPSHITMTGGEPFLRHDIHELIEYVNGRGLGVVIISNGGALREDHVARLRAQKVHYIQLTLAGADAETHDAHCGPGSFERVLRAIRMLVEGGIRTGGSFLCTARSASQAPRVFERFHALGISQVAFNRFNPSGFSIDAVRSLLPSRSQVVDALHEVNAIAGEHGMRVVCTMPIPPCVVDTAVFPHIRFGQCAAGSKVSEPAVGPDGGVRLCTLQRNTLGNAIDGDMRAILSDPGVEAFRQSTPAFCDGCPYQKTCLGGCGAAAEWLLGSASELDPFVAQHVMPDFWDRIVAGQSADASAAGHTDSGEEGGGDA